MTTATEKIRARNSPEPRPSALRTSWRGDISMLVSPPRHKGERDRAISQNNRDTARQRGENKSCPLVVKTSHRVGHSATYTAVDVRVVLLATPLRVLPFKQGSTLYANKTEVADLYLLRL